MAKRKKFKDTDVGRSRRDLKVAQRREETRSGGNKRSRKASRIAAEKNLLDAINRKKGRKSGKL